MTEFADGPKPKPDTLREDLADIAKRGTDVFKSDEAKKIWPNIGEEAEELRKAYEEALKKQGK